MERQDLSLPTSYFFSKNLTKSEMIEKHGFEKLTRIREVCRNGVWFNRPRNSPLALKYMDELMKFNDLKRGFLDEFCDGSYILHTEELQMIKNGEQIWRLEDARSCQGAMIYLDAFLIVVHCDNYRSLPLPSQLPEHQRRVGP